MSNTAHNTNRKTADAQFHNASGMARTSPVPSIPAPVPGPVAVPDASPRSSVTQAPVASPAAAVAPDKVTKKLAASPSFKAKPYRPIRRVVTTPDAQTPVASSGDDEATDESDEVRQPIASVSSPRRKKPRNQSSSLDATANDDERGDEPSRRNPFSSFAWLFEASGGGVIRSSRAGKHYQPLTPVERALFFTGGFFLWGTGAFLTSVFMTMYIPAFKEQARGGILAPGAVLAGVAASTLFMLAELALWKGGWSRGMLVIALGFLGIDIAINVVGCMELFGLKRLGADPASVFTIAVGLGVAVMPERFMSLAWRK